MFWRDWYTAAYPDQGEAPGMDQATFTCKLCGKNHLSTNFRYGVAQFPTTATTARNSQGEHYILCKDHEQAKEKSKHHKASELGGDGDDHRRHGEEANLQGQA